MDNYHKTTNLFPHIKMLKLSPLFTASKIYSSISRTNATNLQQIIKDQHHSIHGEIPVKIR